MDDSGIIFKATNNGLILIMNEDLEFDTIYNQIDKKLTAAGKFFKGASLAVKYRGRRLSIEEINIICSLMTEKTQAVVNSFEEDNNIEISFSEREESYQRDQNSSDHSIIKEDCDPNSDCDSNSRRNYFGGVEEGITKFYRGTVRSGQLISFDGNIVIMGDVNPGAEVQASGNIVVMGWLRGTVHAGIYGNNKAIIASINLQPVQLRIANIITRPPDEQNLKGPAAPEVAFIKDDIIYIERFLPQR